MLMLIAKRLLGAIPVLLGVSFVVFVALQLVPGDVARFILGYSATEENVQALREELGLNRPILIQYGIWLGNVLSGDFGRSIALGVPVTTVILDKIGASLLLMAASLFLVLAFGLGLAAIAGGHHRSKRDRVVVLFTLFCASMPPFWLGIVLLYVFGLQLRMFPISGMYDMANPGGWPDVLHHLVLPAITTAVSSLAIVTRVTRGRMIDVMTQPYILAARARGLSERRVVYLEAVRNVLPTYVGISGLQIGYIFGNAVFSEIVFNWPGIGLQLYQAIIQRDFPVVQGSVLAIAAVFVIGNLISDVLAKALDPRRSA
ncbi:ABC transporter permease [Chthonobacter albigriseus]|uniref:ABC transporter permease n=1 Tax=Chthonobacter albigriseus TaxID=1683161 RepID=UPI0015EE8649|nr:ABC transporter permease [Chthonobacter albigriseus]